MKQLRIFLIFIAAVVVAPLHAQLKIGDNTTICFATSEEARKLLTTRDDFVQCLSPFDRAARMKTDTDVSEAEYLEFVGRNILAWDDGERQKMGSAIQGIHNELTRLSLPFPKSVLIIKTTGIEEGRAAYTRGNAIVIPKGDLITPISNIQKTICHELFHIMTRANPDLREKLYAAIGFVKCNEIAFPSELKPRKITNPDAPRNDHCIRLEVRGANHWAVPILFSDAKTYDAGRGGEFFDYLQFRFLLVDRSDGSLAVQTLYDGQQAMLVEKQDVHGFLEQVGKNTGYTIHPEEILADNFALLLLRQRNVRSPEIMKKLEDILKEKKIAAPGPSRADQDLTH